MPWRSERHEGGVRTMPKSPRRRRQDHGEDGLEAAHVSGTPVTDSLDAGPSELDNTGRTSTVMMDVARLAGVSKQTVSRVFNDHASVRQATRDRVLEAARHLGYNRPNPSARALVTGRTQMLGVITTGVAGYGPAMMLQSISVAARDADYFVSAAPLRSMDRRSLLEAVERLTSQAVDGIIVIASQKSVARALADAPRRVPVVTLDRSYAADIPVVAVDEELGARLATRHLLQLGHRTVWHLAGPADSVAAEERAMGWRAALQEAGAPAPTLLTGDWTSGSGYAQGQELLARADAADVTAVFAANDQMAMGLLRALHEGGRRVPDDISVIGVDDIPEAADMIPPLTTVRHNYGEVGRRCLALMLELLENPPRAWVRSLVPNELVVRRSSAPPPPPA